MTHFRFCPQCGHALAPNPVVAEAHHDEGAYALNLYDLVDMVSGEPHPADDVTELRWFAPEVLPTMAFPHQEQVVARWREAVANEGSVPPQP